MAGCRAGVDRAIAVLSDQIVRTMKLLEVASIEELTLADVTQLERLVPRAVSPRSSPPRPHPNARGSEPDWPHREGLNPSYPRPLLVGGRFGRALPNNSTRDHGRLSIGTHQLNGSAIH